MAKDTRFRTFRRTFERRFDKIQRKDPEKTVLVIISSNEEQWIKDFLTTSGHVFIESAELETGSFQFTLIENPNKKATIGFIKKEVVK